MPAVRLATQCECSLTQHGGLRTPRQHKLLRTEISCLRRFVRTFARVAPEAVARAKEDVQEALTAAHAAGSPLKEASATIASQTKRLAANEDTIERLQAQLAQATARAQALHEELGRVNQLRSQDRFVIRAQRRQLAEHGTEVEVARSELHMAQERMARLSMEVEVLKRAQREEQGVHARLRALTDSLRADVAERNDIIERQVEELEKR